MGSGPTTAIKEQGESKPELSGLGLCGPLLAWTNTYPGIVWDIALQEGSLFGDWIALVTRLADVLCSLEYAEFYLVYFSQTTCQIKSWRFLGMCTLCFQF